MSRESSITARLARLGFAQTQSCAEAIEKYPLLENVLEYLKDAADPDLALLTLSKLIETGAVDFGGFEHDQWQKLTGLLGSSLVLGEHLIKHPNQVLYVASSEGVPARDVLITNLLSSIASQSDWDQSLIELRIAYRREVCAIAALDVVAKAESTSILPGIATALRDRKSTRLNSSHTDISRMPSSA